MDTTGAGEGNLEVIIKDGVDTLKAQLLKREKRKFMIGFYSDKCVKHDIHVIFNEVQIRDSPFHVIPEVSEADTSLAKQFVDNDADDKLPSMYKITEGGPLEGIQCGEKMWILFDAQTPPYYDVQFRVLGNQIGAFI